MFQVRDGNKMALGDCEFSAWSCERWNTTEVLGPRKPPTGMTLSRVLKDVLKECRGPGRDTIAESTIPIFSVSGTPQTYLISGNGPIPESRNQQSVSDPERDPGVNQCCRITQCI